MTAGVFDLFKIGIGPSSSHTVGPMRAARAFAEALAAAGILDGTRRVRVQLFGSLGATGRGHGTDRAVVLGLLGETPDGVDVDAIPRLLGDVASTGRLALLGRREVAFREADALVFERRNLPFHPNGMRFGALGEDGEPLLARTSYSVGGGFVVEEGAPPPPRGAPAPLPFRTAAELLRRCEERGLPPSGVMRVNEESLRSAGEVREGVLRIWRTMEA